MNNADKKCQVCARPAPGADTKITICYGCKAFYRRNLSRKQPVCFMGGHCSTQASNSQRRCKACRWKQCEFLLRTNGSPDGGQKTNEIPVFQDDCTNEDESPDHFYEEFLARKMSETIRLTWSRDSNIIPQFSQACATVTAQPSWSEKILTCSKSIPSEIPQEFCPELTLIDEKPHSIFPQHFSTICRRLTFSKDPPQNFVPLATEFAGNLTENWRQIYSTRLAVCDAVESIFRDQLNNMAACLDRVTKFGRIPNLPEVTLPVMFEEVNKYNANFIVRSQAFISLLPGVNELDPGCQHTAKISWKILVGWMIHHSPYLLGQESYLTVGEKNHHYSMEWAEQISDMTVYAFVFRFSTMIRAIDLTETERYMLMAIVLLEPGNELLSNESVQLTVIHRHYLDVLLESIKERSTCAETLGVMGRKLEGFFGVLPVVKLLYHKYFSPAAADNCPKCSLGSRKLLRQMQLQL